MRTPRIRSNRKHPLGLTSPLIWVIASICHKQAPTSHRDDFEGRHTPYVFFIGQEPLSFGARADFGSSKCVKPAKI
jgi:hypothetical protein